MNPTPFMIHAEPVERCVRIQPFRNGPPRSTASAGAVLGLSLLALSFAHFAASRVNAAPPSNFAVENVITEIEQPITLRFLPDGRMLLLQKKGIIRIVNVTTTPAQSAIYMDLNDPAHAAGINFSNERGLLDIAIDPSFPTQPYIYLFYTPITGGRARIARFTHVQNSGGITSRGNPSSEVSLWQDTDGYNSCCHYGGGLDFGPDGKLWLTTGEHFQGSYATDLTKAGGGVIRINKDGTVPTDNPYYDGSGPNHDALFAKGLRNPFRARWDFFTGRLLIAEVGGNEQDIAWEDLHVLRRDPATGRFVDQDYGTANDNGKYDGIYFGWPTVEGLPPHTDFPSANIQPIAEPVFAYRHNGITAAINGGIVYRASKFPATYNGAYFYADSTRDFVRYIKFNADGTLAPNPNPAPISEQNPDPYSYAFDLAPQGRITCLDVGPDGALYYVSFTDAGGAYGQPNPSVLGAVRRYVYDGGNARPDIVTFTGSPASGPHPLAVQFTIRATDPEGDAMTYIVDFGDGSALTTAQPLPNNTSIVVSHTFATDGIHVARVYVSDPTHTSTEFFSITVGNAPSINSLTVTNSRPGSTHNFFRYGDVMTFAASASDAEDGSLSGANFEWSVSFVRPGNTHPAFGPESGMTSFDFGIPDQGQGFSGPVFYRCFVTVTDSTGLKTSASIDIFPEKSNITFDTIPSGIPVQIDGNTAKPTPFVFDTLINYEHTITVPATYCVNGTQYNFGSWSNGPTTVQQSYLVPVNDTSLTASYVAAGPCVGPPATGLVLRLDANTGVVTNGSAVAGWEDQSAQGNTLTPVGSPTLLAAAVNGRNAIHFDGVDDALRSTGFSGLPTGAGARTVFFVGRYNAAVASPGGWAGFAYGTASTNQAFGLTLTPTGILGVQAWGTSNDFPSNPATDGVAFWLSHSAIYSGGTISQYLNGGAIGSASRNYNTGTGGIRIGEELNGAKNLNMDVAEILVYNRALTEAERQQVESYLNSRYALSSGGGSAPVVDISSPAEGASFTTASMPITLTGSATDTEDGNLSASLQWQSSIDGALGTGASISVSLTPGNHILSATVTDSSDLQATDSVNVTVTTSGGGGGGGLIVDGLVLQLESDLNVSTQSGTTVVGWLDQSGLGNDLIASGGPQLASGLTPSGLPAVSLDGVNDKLERVHAVDPLGGLPTSNGNRTMFLVARYNSSTVWGGAAYGTSTSNQAFGLIIKHPTGELVLHGWSTGNDLVSTSPGLGAGWLVQSGVVNSGTATLFKNGAQIAQFSHTYNTTLTKLVIGTDLKNTGFIGMDVAAVLIYNRALTATERNTVDTYLQSKYLTASSGNTAPVVSIDSPPDNATFTQGTSVTFTGTATDAQQGNLSSTLSWDSDRDGGLGTGASVTTSSLSAGTHVVTASVTDNGGLTGVDSISLTVGANSSPAVDITAPANGATFTAGTSVTFTATATDTEDGNLAASLAWSSDRDGSLGSGASITTASLSAGTHVVTASATDNGGLSGSDTVNLTISSSGGSSQPPVTSGLVAHFETTAGITSTGGTVTTWSDLSGQNNHLTAAGAPTIGSTLSPSGAPAIRLDGVDDKLERIHAVAPLGGLPTGNANRTMFLVARYNSSTVWGGAAYGTSTSNRAFGLIIRHPTGELVLHGWSTGNDLVSTAPGLGAGWLVQSGLVNNGTATLFKDDAQIAQFTHTYNTTLTKLVIGSDLKNTGFIGMDVAAVLIYNRALTAQERTSVNAYLTTKYLQSSGSNTAPSVAITAPADNSTVAQGSSVTFTGTASDGQQGDLSASLNWDSDRDGALGTGASITTSTLSSGTHVVTASVTDNGGLTGVDSINLTVGTNSSPAVSITAPADGATFTAGTSVTFTATATDAEDGNLAASLAWSSDRDGALGTGASVTTSSLSTGTHVISASVSDNGGLTGLDSITVTVTTSSAITPQGLVQLFNGSSLDGLYPWFSDSGFSDPKQVFRVENGRLRVTGNGWGALTTQQRYRDYVLVLDYKWGGRTWAERQGKAKDAGVLIHSNGVEGGWNGLLMPSIQAQIIEGGTGDVILMRGVDASGSQVPMSVTAKTEQLTCTGTTWNCRGGYRWDPGGISRVFNQNLGHIHWSDWDPGWLDVLGYRGSVDIESPDGQWNQLVVVASGATAQVYLNGLLVNELTGVLPTEGRIQLEVEFAEFFVRKWELRPLGHVPPPIIATDQIPGTIVNRPFQFQMLGHGSSEPLTWSIVAGSLPPGLSLTSSTGRIAGTPTTTGTYPVTLRLTDASGRTSSQPFTIAIHPARTLPITAGLVVRFESTDGVTVSGNTVTSWSDLSGQNNHLTAAGAPTLGTALSPSGLPAIRLDGYGDKLERVHASSPLQGLPTGNADRTVFVVSQYDAATAWAGVAYGTGATNQAFGIIVKHPTGELVLHGWGSGQDRVSTTPGIGAGWQLQTATLAASTGSLYVDGNVITQWSHAYNTVLGKLVIAEEIKAKGYADMDVAAVLIYNRALTGTERASVESYLRTKYLTAP